MHTHHVIRIHHAPLSPWNVDVEPLARASAHFFLESSAVGIEVGGVPAAVIESERVVVKSSEGLSCEHMNEQN